MDVIFSRHGRDISASWTWYFRVMDVIFSRHGRDIFASFFIPCYIFQSKPVFFTHPAASIFATGTILQLAVERAEGAGRVAKTWILIGLFVGENPNFHSVIQTNHSGIGEEMGELRMWLWSFWKAVQCYSQTISRERLFFCSSNITTLPKIKSGDEKLKASTFSNQEQKCWVLLPSATASKPTQRRWKPSPNSSGLLTWSRSAVFSACAGTTDGSSRFPPPSRALALPIQKGCTVPLASYREAHLFSLERRYDQRTSASAL